MGIHPLLQFLQFDVFVVVPAARMYPLILPVVFVVAFFFGESARVNFAVADSTADVSQGFVMR
jgi:hypothetical protein